MSPSATTQPAKADAQPSAYALTLLLTLTTASDYREHSAGREATDLGGAGRSPRHPHDSDPLANLEGELQEVTDGQGHATH